MSAQGRAAEEADPSVPRSSVFLLLRNNLSRKVHSNTEAAADSGTDRQLCDLCNNRHGSMVFNVALIPDIRGDMDINRV